MPSDRSSKSVRKAVIARATGNVLLGMALGLLGYTLATGFISEVAQTRLVRELPAAAAVQISAETSSSVMDWEGWQTEDRAYWRRLKDGQAFGRIVAPAMGLDSVIVKGTSRDALTRGPGWMTWTDPPGPTGNCGIAGHRTTFGAPFRHIDRLREGDYVRIISPYRVYTYRFQRLFSVTPDRGDVVRSTGQPVLTLTACHPPYSARLRLVARLKLESVVLIER